MEWDYFGTIYQMTLASGIFGATVLDDTYKCVVGWVVGEATKE